MTTDHPKLFPSGQDSERHTRIGWQAGGAACLVGLSVFLTASVLHSRLFKRRVQSPTAWLLLSNATLGILSGLFAMKLMTDEIESRADIRNRLDLVAEMNHHIRNALQVIELSAHSTKNADAIASITEAVARIEKVLRELVGTGAERPNSIPLRRVG
jgi:hypothetical protein